MTFRITPLIQFERIQYDLTRAYARLAAAQNQISTGKRILFVSEDTASASSALNVRNSLSKAFEQRESVTSARFASDTQSATLEEVSSLIIQARATGLEAAAGTKSPTDLATLAAEIDGILKQIIGRANTHFDGRHIFAGSKIGVLPFKETTASGFTAGVTYLGDDIARQVRLGPAEVKNVDLTGADAFLTYQRGSTSIASQIGLEPTPGANDTVVGTKKISITHVSTTFGDGLGAGGADSVSGLAPGASSANDSIVGPAGAHKLTVLNDPLSGGPTISLDGGPPVSFTGTETDLKLTGDGGTVVHVDVSALAPGFEGVVDLQADATIAIEGGAPQALAFSGDYLLKDGEGRVVHLDTSSVDRVGDSLAVFPGTETVFDVLIGLRDELLGKTGFPSQGYVERVQSRLLALDRSHDGVLSGLAELGARSESFDRIANSLAVFELALEERRGQLEDTDLLVASLDLSNAESGYETALAVAARISRGPSLLDYL